VVRAEAFAVAVEKAFALNESSITNDLQNDGHNPKDKISEPDLAMEKSETDYVRLKPISLEEIRRQARENWLQLRQRNIEAAKGISDWKDAGRGAREDQGYSIDDDLGE
jgi:hypothetical protein